MTEKLAAFEAHIKRYVSDEKAARQVALYKAMSGTPEQIIERLREWEAAGMTYTIVYFPDPAYDTGSMDLFAEKVIPAFS